MSPTRLSASWKPACESIPPWFENSDDLYGHSMEMRDVMALIGRAAGMRAGVLIRGEQGTGRQVAARAIHTLQHSADGAFVAVDCAGCGGEELDVDLFGPPMRGQNGDAAKGLERVSRQARLHRARGGTLYLQHIAEAPTRVQGRLARLLRDREAIIAETGETAGFDVRPMAGVNHAFDTAVQDGRVREDLFRRLSVIRIDMPALRNRREDIPALRELFPPRDLRRPAPAAQDAVALGALAALGAAVAGQRCRAPAPARRRGHRHAGRPRHRAG